ncbi:MAG: hypothetical protein Fur0025_23700 [Oscillatoriaceae cyanobacterium]
MDRNAKIERIGEVLALILHLMRGEAFSKTKLVKLIYLLDVIQSRKGRHNFSGVDFRSYYYGPYSEDIEESISLLANMGYISVTLNQSPSGTPYYHFKLNTIPSFGRVTDEDKRQIQEYLMPLIELNSKQLLNISSETKEYREVELGEAIRL